MPSPLIECVPNFSEGRDSAIVEAIVAAMAVDGVSLLDFSRDPDHNRSVVTIVGPTAGWLRPLFGERDAPPSLTSLLSAGCRRIRHVIPFVPVRDISLEQCVLFARQAVWPYGTGTASPSYHEAAAARPTGPLLNKSARASSKVLSKAVKNEVARRPDVGGPGASSHCRSGCRWCTPIPDRLESLNTADVATARSIAREIRASEAFSR